MTKGGATKDDDEGQDEAVAAVQTGLSVVRCQRVLAVPIAIPNCLPQWTDKVLDCMCGSVLNRATMCSGNEMMAASQCDTDTS